MREGTAWNQTSNFFVLKNNRITSFKIDSNFFAPFAQIVPSPILQWITVTPKLNKPFGVDAFQSGLLRFIEMELIAIYGLRWKKQESFSFLKSKDNLG